jgi:hypothetical protein
MLLLMSQILTAVPGRDVVSRLRKALLRHNAWLERVLDEFRQLQQTPDDANLDGFIKRQTELAALRARHRDEAKPLIKKWNEILTGTDQETRDELTELLNRGEGLAEKIRVEYGNTAALLEERKKQNLQSIQTIRQRRGVIRKYAPGRADETTYVDRDG